MFRYDIIRYATILSIVVVVFSLSYCSDDIDDALEDNKEEEVIVIVIVVAVVVVFVAVFVECVHMPLPIPLEEFV